jgi:hypothetical protein
MPRITLAMQGGACLAAGAASGADAPGAVVAAVCLSLLAAELSQPCVGGHGGSTLYDGDDGSSGGLLLAGSIDTYHGCCGGAGGSSCYGGGGCGDGGSCGDGGDGGGGCGGGCGG